MLTYKASKAPLITLITLYSMALIILTITGIQDAIPTSVLTKDPNSITSLPFYAGILSNLGILFWCSTVAICIFTFLVVNPINRETRSFVLYVGLLTLLLMLDDQFLLHEEVLPNFLGLPGKIVYVIYAISLAAILFLYRNIILNFDPLLLAFPLLFFALSVVSKVVLNQGLLTDVSIDPLLVEDGAKFMGIVGWFFYFANYCYFVTKNKEA